MVLVEQVCISSLELGILLLSSLRVPALKDLYVHHRWRLGAIHPLPNLRVDLASGLVVEGIGLLIDRIKNLNILNQG